MTKGCYTCRRRRIICDNGLPTCRKCRDAGKECLGYQKPLVWVKGGVASRGKMMGRTFDDIVSTSSRTCKSSINAEPVEQIGPLQIQNARETGSSATHVQESNGQASAQAVVTYANYTPTPRSLVDPVVKDLSPMTRRYISHFLANCDFSPTPWATDASALTKTVLSPQDVEKAVVSSMTRRPSSKTYEHFLGLKQRTLHQLSLDLRDPDKRNDSRILASIMMLALMDAIESGDGAWKYHLEGAKKLLMSRGLEKNAPLTRSVTDSLHTFAIDGFLLIQLMGSTLARPGSLTRPFYSSDMGPEVLKRLEQTSWVGCPAYLLEVIFILHEGWCAQPDSNSSSHPTMNFHSTFLPEGSNPFQFPCAILHHIKAFDPLAWAEDMQSCLYLPDLSMRVTLASVFRAAVYLYAGRVLSQPRTGVAQSHNSGLPSDHSDVTNSLIREIAFIPITDPHFKCLIWPTFIAGAECRDPCQRPILLQTLSNLYYDITSINVRNAAWVLSLMWRKRDARRQGTQQENSVVPLMVMTPPGSSNSPSVCEIDDDFDWFQELDDSRIDWLFI
ncbi:hypothetical protein EYZ11_011615 [Aspergillus tanneri]|uniref:Zn(2)-C6 fungal-type domain-containing protein n=1 Tax=Aspergillus tanneri TaxID=1220188 RepID=A0A4S3J2D2_9EURO|nr:hypothetical protein EYZ11_011615 [Aspergillus tanneri]